MTTDPKAIGWQYEVATEVDADGVNCGWELRLSTTKPYTARWNIRNLVPIYSSNSKNINLILGAVTYATQMHGDQKRKYTGEPYMMHCLEVASTVAAIGCRPAIIAAALLHDVVEDTPATQLDVLREFGGEVQQLVLWLTDISGPGDGNRATRKAMDREHIAGAPADAKTIKLADLISNTRSIVAHDPGFAKVYLAEKALLLPMLTDGDPRLWGAANQMVVDGLWQIAKEGES